MVLIRDRHLALKARKINNLRLERHKRLRFLNSLFCKLTILAVLRDGGTPDISKSLAKIKYNTFPYWQRQTIHRSRCWESARARQVKRSTLLARLHLRVNVMNNTMGSLRLNRN